MVGVKTAILLNMEMKTAVITGAARGIGRAITTTLGKSGYRVVLLDKNFPSDFDQYIDGLTKDNVPHLVLQVDITKPKERAWLVGELKSTFGSFHALVHNAGVHFKTSFKALTPSQYHHTMDVNLNGAVFLTQDLMPLLQEDAAIVFVSSIRAYVGSDHGIDYAISKSGMLGAMRALAVELAPRVRANAVAPFSIDTTMLNEDSKADRKQRIEQTILKRLGKPEDVANAVKFLLSDEASFITGQVIHVNGGAYFG